MANSNGFDELAGDLERMAERITDPRVKRKVLSAGADVLVSRARIAPRPGRRTGTLAGSIAHEYDESTEKQRIGWRDKGFYGRFHEDGWRPLKGKRGKRSVRQWRKVAQRGRVVQNPHIRPAFAAERDNIGRRMIETYQQEIGG